MTEPPGDRDPEQGTTRRWQRALGIVVAIVLLLIIVAMLIGGGEHGPARHSAALPAGGLVDVSW
ncbi:MAG TPA: hypothetical protein VK891_04860 [Euzebyales bacterium]|nr:hypothetical protein [Euzebyales bacterium]